MTNLTHRTSAIYHSIVATSVVGTIKSSKYYYGVLAALRVLLLSTARYNVIKTNVCYAEPSSCISAVLNLALFSLDIAVSIDEHISGAKRFRFQKCFAGNQRKNKGSCQ